MSTQVHLVEGKNLLIIILDSKNGIFINFLRIKNNKLNPFQNLNPLVLLTFLSTHSVIKKIKFSFSIKSIS